MAEKKSYSSSKAEDKEGQKAVDDLYKEKMSTQIVSFFVQYDAGMETGEYGGDLAMRMKFREHLTLVNVLIFNLSNFTTGALTCGVYNSKARSATDKQSVELDATVNYGDTDLSLKVGPDNEFFFVVDNWSTGGGVQAFFNVQLTFERRRT